MSAGVLVGFSLFVYFTGVEDAEQRWKKNMIRKKIIFFLSYFKNFTGVEDAEQRHALKRLRKVEDLHA